MKSVFGFAGTLTGIVVLLCMPARADKLDDSIKTMCADKWPDNFDMQSYCVDKQTVALKDFVARAPRDKNHPLYKASLGCFGKWTKNGDQTNWDMVMYCFDKQEEGYRKLNP